ncbi:MAG: nucleotidyltransferase [Acidobacteria bacterium]|nr:MAG: nucleotidyltransferase [Acidobacteriota bacterium]
MRAEPKALADVLFGKGRGAILGLLYEHPDESFYYRQLARELGGLSVGTIQRELDLLSQLGLLERSTVGKQVFYRANRSHPVFPELRSLVAKTVGTIPMLRSALAGLVHSIVVSFIYGSMARGEEKPESDIDLMVVGKASLEDVLGKLSNAEASLRRAVNPTVYSPSEFKTKLTSGNHFLNSVVRGEKIFLIGDEDELREVGGIRLAQNGTDKSRRD